MNRIIISIGSNTADRATRMDEALRWLGLQFPGLKTSSIYETPEYHGVYAPYFNCVAEAASDLSAEDIVCLFKNYELSQGRTPESKKSGQVPIDLDVVMFNNENLRPHETVRDYFLIGYRQLN